MPEVQFPFAMREGVFTHVREVLEGDHFTCVDDTCGAEMIPKRGEIRTHHFAHKSDLSEQTCYGESWLHKASKRAIKGGFEAALVSGASYLVSLHCLICQVEIWKLNLAKEYQQVKLEAADIARVRSDVRFTGAARRPLVIEVLVSHPIDSTTFNRYEQAGVILGTARPKHHDLLGFATEGIMLEGLHFMEAPCPSCEERAKDLELSAQRREAHRLTAEAERQARQDSWRAEMVQAAVREEMRSSREREDLNQKKIAWLETWEEKGQPVIDLGPGETIHDLKKFLTGWVSPKHRERLTEVLTHEL